ncbi:hypothetical protein IJ425_04165 [bacterium]|nr:hypothetical protein [bacterium]
MQDEILFNDLKLIYYALQVVFTAKQADAIMNRLAKRLKKAKEKLT